MFRLTLIKASLRDLGDDIAHYTVAVTHGVFDLTCVIVLGLAVYASGLPTGADGPSQPVNPGVSTNMAANMMAGPMQPCAASLGDTAEQRICITATVLKPSNS